MRQGMKVAIGDLDEQAARRTAEELGASAAALPLDVTDRDSFAAFLDAAEERLGPLDVLVNNAGIMQIGRFVDEDDLTARRMIDINLHGVILGCKLALERMIPRDRGHIVNISSQAGKFGAPGGATYSATKHAVVGLTEAIRGELRLMGAHIDVSYVMPFVVNTELGSGLGEARGMTNLEPSEVADAIVEALQHGIVDVWVPKRNNQLGTLLPRALSEGMVRMMKADRVLAGADLNRRRDYELRASRSEPGLEPGAAPPQIAAGTRPGADAGEQASETQAHVAAGAEEQG
jgi:NADP-dependent 3-hydroxy acid dehydrogenase YdfG